MSTQGQGDVASRANVMADMLTAGDKIRYGDDAALLRELAEEITRLRTLLSLSRGEQGPLAIALRTLSLIAEGHEKRMPDGTTEVWDVEDAAEVAKSAIAAVQSLTAAPSAPGSVPTSLAGQGTDTCTCDEFQSCPRCHTANLDPDWLEKELAEVATQPTAGGDAPTFDTPKSEPNLEPSNVFSNALSAERARVIEPLQKIIERSENGELGTSKVRDMANIAKAALRALGQQDTGDQS